MANKYSVHPRLYFRVPMNNDGGGGGGDALESRGLD
jgi:hypothetical protein